jgi:hypothetical protein
MNPSRNDRKNKKNIPKKPEKAQTFVLPIEGLDLTSGF